MGGMNDFNFDMGSMGNQFGEEEEDSDDEGKIIETKST